MGSGTWSTANFASYTTSTRGMTLDAYTTSTSLNVQDVYKARHISPLLDPKNVMRECCDSEEHPNTLPVILALDVTGSMGDSAVRVAQKLNEIITDIYADGSIKDVQFCVMGIGDLSCDDAPIQISQFESDIRIAEQMDAIYFEGGGGGNRYESYTAAWYMGTRHCKLDCWDRGAKGIIITLGDELPNPYLPKHGWSGGLAQVTGDNLQGNVETKDLLDEVREKYNVYHLSVKDRSSSYDYHQKRYNLDEAWTELLGKDNYSVVTLDNLSSTIVDIIRKNANNTPIVNTTTTTEVSW